MRTSLYISLISCLLFFSSCGEKHGDIIGEFDKLKAGETDNYTMAYAYAAYLSTTTTIKAEEAIPLISELISMRYPTAARYCIDNLERNGIHSYDLLALHGLCYQNEEQDLLAGADLEAAARGDPENEKIRTLLNNFRKQSEYTEDSPLHEKLFREGLTCISQKDYDSALVLIKQAMELEERPEYEHYIIRTEKVIEGEQMINSTPGNFKAYMLKSQGLSAMQLFGEAQITLDGGLIACPDNLNLILAKALVWVQQGEVETARLYLWEQEQRGIAIDPAVKQRILQTKN